MTIDNIQKTVAEYYKIKVADLLSKRRSRSVARPRQMAMAMAKELTNHSLPEIGDAFGVVIILRCYTPAAKSSSCVKRVTTLKKISLI